MARRVLAVAAMLLGTLAGALLALEVFLAAALALALALSAATAPAAHELSARPARWSAP